MKKHKIILSSIIGIIVFSIGMLMGASLIGIRDPKTIIFTNEEIKVEMEQLFTELEGGTNYDDILKMISQMGFKDSYGEYEKEDFKDGVMYVTANEYAYGEGPADLAIEFVDKKVISYQYSDNIDKRYSYNTRNIYDGELSETYLYIVDKTMTAQRGIDVKDKQYALEYITSHKQSNDTNKQIVKEYTENELLDSLEEKTALDSLYLSVKVGDDIFEIENEVNKSKHLNKLTFNINESNTLAIIDDKIGGSIYLYIEENIVKNIIYYKLLDESGDKISIHEGEIEEGAAHQLDWGNFVLSIENSNDNINRTHTYIGFGVKERALAYMNLYWSEITGQPLVGESNMKEVQSTSELIRKLFINAEIEREFNELVDEMYADGVPYQMQDIIINIKYGGDKAIEEIILVSEDANLDSIVYTYESMETGYKYRIIIDKSSEGELSILDNEGNMKEQIMFFERQEILEYIKIYEDEILNSSMSQQDD